jgi:hypothetical protein
VSDDMSDFNVGDKIEILYHENSEYTGRQGKIMFIGTGLRQGTDMLENNINLPEQDSRLIVALDDNTVVNNIRGLQLRKL